MRVSVRWHSQPGNRTEDNRDCAGVGLAGNTLLAVVADGSTAGKDSGQFARSLVRDLVDWFAGTSGKLSEGDLSGRLQRIHGFLAREFPRASASYMIIVLRPQHACLVGYAGDCILGKVTDGGAISWLTAPDTLANALSDIPIEELAKARSRHLLTRSFRAREFLPPSFRTFENTAVRFLVATDGFWGELPFESQRTFLSGIMPPTLGEHDDRSVLELEPSELAATSMERVDVSGEVYLRRGT